MSRARSILFLVLIGAVALRVVWWAIEPIVTTLIPLASVLLVLVVVGGALYYRSRRW